MDRCNGVDRLDFHDDKIFHQNIQPESEINPDTAVNDWQR